MGIAHSYIRKEPNQDPAAITVRKPVQEDVNVRMDVVQQANPDPIKRKKIFLRNLAKIRGIEKVIDLVKMEEIEEPNPKMV